MKSNAQEALMKTSPRSPLTEINGSTIPPPPIGLSEAARAGGCFGFLLSSSSCKSSSKTLWSTPQSSPSDPRIVSSKCSTKVSRNRTMQIAPSRSDLELAKKISKPTTTASLLKKWNRSNPTTPTGKEPKEKLVCVDSPRGKIGSCSASTQKSFSSKLINNGGFKEVTATPTLIAAPPIEASISPEIPIGASEVADTPVCFGTGHLMAGVQDRRKCRPRGILKIGESEEHQDSILQESSTPPIVEASVHWMSPPSGYHDSEDGTGLRSCSREPSATKASVDWLISRTQDEDDALNRFFSTLDCVSGTETSVYHSARKFSSSNSSLKGSPDLFSLLSLKKSGFESTPSSGISVQKTPSTGGSISPFSMILERVARASNRKLAKAQQSLQGQQNGFTPDKLILSAIKGDKLKDVIGSRKRISNDLNVQESLSAEYFQFECPPLSLDSIDLNYFQKTSHDVVPSAKGADKELQKRGTRISWREGLVSRIFEMGELEYCNWLSDDEGSLNDMEEANSVEFACAASAHAKIDALVSPTAPISRAEAASIDGLDFIYSGDSDWVHFYRNRLFEV